MKSSFAEGAIVRLLLSSICSPVSSEDILYGQSNVGTEPLD